MPNGLAPNVWCRTTYLPVLYAVETSWALKVLRQDDCRIFLTGNKGVAMVMLDEQDTPTKYRTYFDNGTPTDLSQQTY